MIEVLHLIDTYRVGGPGKTIINSAKFIDPTRYRVHVGAWTNPRAGHNEFATAVAEAGIPFLDLRETRRLQPEHVLQIRRYLRDQNIRILHLHGYRTDLMGYLATRGLRGVRVLTTHHGWIRNTKKQEQVARFAQWLCRRFDAVQVVSAKLREELSPALLESGRAVVVHNGIVPADYRREGRGDAVRQSLSLAPDAIVLGTIGRFSPEKGCLDVLAAFRTIAAAVPRTHLVLIGEGPLADELHRQVAEAGLTSRVSFVPHQTHVQQYYEALDMLVSPSHTEGISNVILEAMTFGVPVVATAVGGTPEIIEDGRSGVLVPPREPAALASAVVRVLSDDDVRRHLAEGARRRIDEAFTFEARMRKEEALYENILAGRLRDARSN
jgi:glycosyltransferase involved in cell wall biosynthesis